MADISNEASWIDLWDDRGFPELYKQACGKVAPPLYVGLTLPEALRAIIHKLPAANTSKQSDLLLLQILTEARKRLNTGASMELTLEPWESSEVFMDATKSAIACVVSKGRRRAQCSIPPGHPIRNHHIFVGR